jgi:hyperosmotically inducible protein
VPGAILRICLLVVAQLNTRLVECDETIIWPTPGIRASACTSALMQLFKIAGGSVIGFGLLLGSGARPANGQTKPDNTAENKRDQNPDEATADQQKMNVADRDITARIRRSIMADKSLSTYAHNVKIISQDGIVTLKGPVRSDDEVQSIVSKATDVTGNADKIINQMSVAPKR